MPAAIDTYLRPLLVLGDVDHCTIRIAHEESAKSPLLISERVDDLRSCGASALMNSVDIVHLDRDIGMNPSLDVEPHHAELHLALIGAEEEDPVEPIATFETDHVVVKRAALVKPLRQDVRLDPFHGHAPEV